MNFDSHEVRQKLRAEAEPTMRANRMAEEKQCFIIMPISTPDTVRDRYRDGAEHFRHVLDCLLIPSIKRANFKPVPPIAKGADLIHAEIITQLESADLVLCDMSSLNPNVFFEFGIRTALNKPVCVVKDDVTDKVPFDTGILNHQEYKSALEPWELDVEIAKISEHIKQSFVRSKNTNTLWRYFGAKTEATPAKGESGTDERLDLLFMQMDILRQELSLLSDRRGSARFTSTNSFGDSSVLLSTTADLAGAMRHIMSSASRLLQIVQIEQVSPSSLRVVCKGKIDHSFVPILSTEVRDIFGCNVEFVRRHENDAVERTVRIARSFDSEASSRQLAEQRVPPKKS